MSERDELARAPTLEVRRRERRRRRTAEVDDAATDARRAAEADVASRGDEVAEERGRASPRPRGRAAERSPSSRPSLAAERPSTRAGELDVPDGYTVLEGRRGRAPRASASSSRASTARSPNGCSTSALDELERAGVAREAVTVMPVPGAFELPLAAMALAKTRRYSCVVALGCVIRGETPHFDYVAGEAASGLQLAALETGVPVAFGVLTVETVEQAEARIDKGAEAVRTALEMADVFAQLRASAAR